MGSIRWRLTIYHALVILGIAALLLGIGLFAFYRSVTTAVEETTRSRVIETERLLETGTFPTQSAPTAEVIAQPPLESLATPTLAAFQPGPNDPTAQRHFPGPTARPGDAPAPRPGGYFVRRDAALPAAPRGIFQSVCLVACDDSS